MTVRKATNRALSIGCLAALAVAPASATDWPAWRGPEANGVSRETGLVSSWSQEGENLLWRRDFTGRSTPVVFDGRVCAIGRAGEGITRQETAACFDAETGEQLWERRFNVYHTTVPWNRVGWANPTGDPETGYLYVQGVGGLFYCLDSRDGSVIWWRNLIEDFGFMEGYGGRTQTPAIDEDRLVVHFANLSWGDQAPPRHRIFAFDKRTGEVLWTSSPASSMADKNTQSTPAVAVVGGRRLIIAGNGDGWIYAVEARTGEKVWGFHLSKRGINTSVLVDGTTVYAAHSEENVDQPTMGRVVAIDATGSGDVTKSHEIWRAGLGVGFSSPVLAGGRLFALDNSAELHTLDAKTGKELWSLRLGRVGKGSPVWADGRLYVTEVNGRFLIVEPGEEGGRILDEEEISMPRDERYAEVYGSPAVANGRIYFTTEEGIYCLGKTGTGSAGGRAAEPALAAEAPVVPDAAPARLRLRPADVELRPGESVELAAFAFTGQGQPLGQAEATWSLAGLAGTVPEGAAASGRFTADPGTKYQTGTVVAKLGELTAAARVRVVAPLPFADDFEGYEAGAKPAYLKSAIARFEVQEKDGNKVLAKNPSPVQLHRHHTLIGAPGDSDYTVQADVMGTRTGRRIADVGLVNSGYLLDLQGAAQKLQIRSWSAALRMAREVDFAWEVDRWYTMKLQVTPGEKGALVRGKVWPKGEPEPEAWTLTVEDPLSIDQGSPGLIGYTPSPAYWDNVRVTPN